MLAVESWLATLAAGRKKPGTVKSYGTVVKAAIREMGWHTTADLTGANVIAYLNRKVEGGDWPAGATRNRAMSSFRSLVRHLRLLGKLSEDPLEFAERAEDEGRQRIRAATVDEARALIAYVYHRESIDRRGGGQRALYWLAEFAVGCRPGEPIQWRWRHLVLEAPIPFIDWTPEIQKNKRHEPCAMPPELVPLLRAHRERSRGAEPVVIRNRRAGTITLRPVDSSDPDAFVFGHAPDRSTFHRDREGAGIRAVDDRGLRFTQRSGRRYFKTTAVAEGIHGDVVRFLQRHKRWPDEAYHDLSLETQAEALAKLPRIWPPWASVDNSEIPRIQVDTGKDRCFTSTVKPTIHQSDSAMNPGHECRGPSASQTNAQSAWLGFFTELAQQSGLTVQIAGPGVQSADFSHYGKGRCRSENPGRIAPLTAFLRALAALLDAGDRP